MKTLRNAVLDELLMLIKFYRDGTIPEQVVGMHPRVASELVVSLVHASMVLSAHEDAELDGLITDAEIDARDYDGEP